MKRRLGDRSDGFLLRNIDPFFRMIPHLMQKRTDSQVFFEERIYIEHAQKVIRELRNEGYRVGFLHIVIASMVRVMSQKPKFNRFIRGRKHYARREISISFAIKKQMSEKGEETTIKVKFEPDATIYDVIDVVNEAVSKNKKVEEKNSTDKIVKLFRFVPQCIVAGTIGTIKILDNMGILPKFIIELSPFHSSIFITDVGSIGIKPIYHHLYDIGTNSAFIAFGTRVKEQVVSSDLKVENKKALDIRVVADERIVDGFYFAGVIKLTSRIMKDPSCLKEKPEHIVIDDEI